MPLALPRHGPARTGRLAAQGPGGGL